MAEEVLTDRVKEEISALAPLDIIVGIPSYNNAATIGSVVTSAQAGLLESFPDRKALIVNSDGGSKDGTVEAFKHACRDGHSLTIEHPVYPVHHLTTPYHGLPARGNAFRTLFRITELAGARALLVVDAGFHGVAPGWFNPFLDAILNKEFDYAVPLYRRHKYDGALTNCIVYPLMRALYGRRIRQPIGGEVGISGRLARHLLTRNIWNTDVARYAIDIWMATAAVAENYKVCQVRMGAKSRDLRDQSSDLSTILVQVVGSVFGLMETYDSIWRNVLGSLPTPLMGDPCEAPMDPVSVNIPRLHASFQQGVRDLRPIYEIVFTREQLSELEAHASQPLDRFSLPEELWVGLIYEAALAHHRRAMDREHLLKSLAPLYLGWVASFARQTENEDSSKADERIEKLCLAYEQLKTYLINQWPLA